MVENIKGLTGAYGTFDASVDYAANNFEKSRKYGANSASNLFELQKSQKEKMDKYTTESNAYLEKIATATAKTVEVQQKLDETNNPIIKDTSLSLKERFEKINETTTNIFNENKESLDVGKAPVAPSEEELANPKEIRYAPNKLKTESTTAEENFGNVATQASMGFAYGQLNNIKELEPTLTSFDGKKISTEDMGYAFLGVEKNGSSDKAAVNMLTDLHYYSQTGDKPYDDLNQNGKVNNVKALGFLDVLSKYSAKGDKPYANIDKETITDPVDKAWLEKVDLSQFKDKTSEELKTFTLNAELPDYSDCDKLGQPKYKTTVVDFGDKELVKEKIDTTKDNVVSSTEAAAVGALYDVNKDKKVSIGEYAAAVNQADQMADNSFDYATSVEGEKYLKTCLAAEFVQSKNYEAWGKWAQESIATRYNDGGDGSFKNKESSFTAPAKAAK